MGEFSNSIVLSKLKIKTRGKYLWLRSIFSTIVGEALDTIIFIFISFVGIMENSILFQMMLFQYLFKLCYEIIFLPITYAIIKYIKKKECIDAYDYQVKYNPFSIK